MHPLIQKDHQFIWHPFTQHQNEPDPIAISHAKDATLYDVDGKAYLDLISSWWTCLHGHAHPSLIKALHEQAQKMSHVMFAGFTHEPAVTLAEAISKRLPGDLSKVFFSDNGSTAVEVALKIAFHYWRNKGQAKNKFIAFDGGYHGDTFGAMSVGKGSQFFSLYNDLLLEVHTLPYGETWQGDEKVLQTEQICLKAFDELIELEGQHLAALIIEPLVQGAGGMRMCRPEFINQLVTKAKQAEILVIFDEVATGFGRTGSLFALEQCALDQKNFAPDLICLSKGLTGGTMPLSLTVASKRLFDGFLGEDFTKALAHGHSYTANPLACAVANRSVALFEEEKSFDRIKMINEAHQNFLDELKTHPKVERPRIRGTIMAFDLKLETTGYKSSVSENLRKSFLKEGLNIRPLGKTIYLMPPLCIKDEELARAYKAIANGISKIV